MYPSNKIAIALAIASLCVMGATGRKVRLTVVPEQSNMHVQVQSQDGVQSHVENVGIGGYAGEQVQVEQSQDGVQSHVENVGIGGYSGEQVQIEQSQDGVQSHVENPLHPESEWIDYSGKICTDDNGESLTTYDASDLDECKHFCTTSDDCTAVSYNVVDNKCYLKKHCKHPEDHHGYESAALEGV